MIKIGNNDTKLYLGNNEIEKVYLGTSQVYSGGSEPAEPYRFKLIDNQGNEYVDNTDSYLVDFPAIDRLISNEGISPENIVELQIGDYATEVDINLDYINNFYNVSGITVGKNVTVIRYISNAQMSPDTLNIELQWIKLKCKSIPDISISREYTFYNTNCCPILVRRSLMQDYKDEWLQYNEGVCGASLSERIDAYEEVPYEEQYLTIKSLEDDNTIYWKKSNSSTQGKTISASTDNGATWTAYTSTTGNGTTIATLNSGDKVLVKGENATYADNWDSQAKFASTSSFITYGNIMSLISGDSFENADTLTGTYTFCGLFNGCTGLSSAENLILPATTLADNCYYQMFKNCTSLTTAPELSATTLADYCYGEMFYGCTSLTTAPELPATTLADGCYTAMFIGCTSLTVAPELPATTLVTGCYNYMFSGCTNLNEITFMSLTAPSTSYTHYWVSGVASSGTFYKNSNAAWSDTFGSSLIPKSSYVRWTVATKTPDSSGGDQE